MLEVKYTATAINGDFPKICMYTALHGSFSGSRTLVAWEHNLSWTIILDSWPDHLGQLFGHL